MNREGNVSKKTKMKVLLASGCRCEFEGCGLKLDVDLLSGKKVNKKYFAHIIAASPKGPRGDEKKSALLYDNESNIMLLCDTHHKLIDSNETIYTVDRLNRMKVNHENNVQKLLDGLIYPKTRIVSFTSPIKNFNNVFNDSDLMKKAINGKYMLDNDIPAVINIQNVYSYNTSQYWNECIINLKRECKRLISEYNYDHIGISLFPLAPIPLIIKLGEIIGDKCKVDIYQKTREPDTWEWLESNNTNYFTIEKIVLNKIAKNIALVMEVTSEISIDRVTDVYKADVIYKLKATHLGVDAIKSKEDLSQFWHMYQLLMDEIKNEYKEIENCSMFNSIPVSVAFEIGRRYMPKVYPIVDIYDEYNGFIKTLSLGDDNND